MLFKRKFNLKELVDINSVETRVLLFEPKKYLRDLYLEKFLESGIQVAAVDSWLEVFNTFLTQKPRLLVVSCGINEDFDFILSNLKRIFADSPELLAITMGDSLPLNVLSKAMGLGVCGHMERKFTRPKDLVTVVYSLLNKD